MLKIREIRSESGIIPRLAVRWLMIALATIFAFWPTWTKLWQSTASGTAIGYVFALPLLCLVAAVGTDLRRGPELPIHDRETDKIVGCIGLFVALGLQALLLPRFAETYELMHIDVIAAWVFVWSAADHLGAAALPRHRDRNGRDSFRLQRPHGACRVCRDHDRRQ